LGPRLYREIAQPFERRLVAGLKAAAAAPVSLHVCGDATPILAYMGATGADVLEIDHQVDLGTACDVAGSATTLWGNIDPVAVLWRGTPAAVEAASRRAIEAVHARGHRRFVLSSGCTLAPGTPDENVDALVRAVRSPVYDQPPSA